MKYSRPALSVQISRASSGVWQLKSRLEVAGADFRLE